METQTSRNFFQTFHYRVGNVTRLWNERGEAHVGDKFDAFDIEFNG